MICTAIKTVKLFKLICLPQIPFILKGVKSIFTTAQTDTFSGMCAFNLPFPFKTVKYD